jgi:hypothetical protein
MMNTCLIRTYLSPANAAALYGLDPTATAEDLPVLPHCIRYPEHEGFHYAILRVLEKGAVWIRWMPEGTRGVVRLDDCEHHGCTLFRGHRGPHPR